ncbi:histidine phosphatase family protein [Microbacteriaceae bacterium K1510]|nr:histidine phosphatase family protein [Microbacteriaceae bacterium K1510]
MSAEQRFWLIRHAPVARPHGIIHDADAPADLSNRAALTALRERLPETLSVFASPARRTMETAVALGLKPTPEPRLREQNFGAWTGRRHAEIEAELGPAYTEFWRKPATNRPPSGESFEDQIARVRDCLPTLPAGDVALVIHSGTIRAILAIALDLPAENALRFVIDPLSLTQIDRLDQGWRVRTVNVM